MQEVSNERAHGQVTMGLNDMVSGGLPPDRLYLVEGEPGSGKTTLALQFSLLARDPLRFRRQISGPKRFFSAQRCQDGVEQDAVHL